MRTVPPLEEVKEQVAYDAETGEFTYLQERWIKRKFFDKAVEPKPTLAQSANTRADKVYGEIRPFVGVYIRTGYTPKHTPAMAVVSASSLAIYLTTGNWPDAVLYKDGDWRNIRFDNLTAITQSELGAFAAVKTHKHERTLPSNVYGTSGGQFIGRKGKRKTIVYDTPSEAAYAVATNLWV